MKSLKLSESSLAIVHAIMQRVTRQGLAVALAIVALPAVNWAQTGPAKPPAPANAGASASQQEAPFSIRSKVQYVLVPVVVTDKKDRFKPGLKKEDFRIFDGGKPVTIATMEEVKAKAAPVGSVRPSAQDEYNNHLAGDASPKRLIIVALDLINTPFFDEARAREAVFKYLSSSLDGNAVIQLVAISGKGVRVLHDFTDDPRVLIAALKRVSIARKGNAMDSGTSATDPLGENDPTLVRLAAEQLESINTLVERQSSYQQRLNTEDTLIALRHIAQASAGLPGRKSLIWLSAGLPFPRFSMRSSALSGDVPMSYFERTMEMLSNANVAVYPVNAKGLFDPGYRDASQMTAMNRVRDQDRYAATIDSMVQFAATTGGKAYFDRNDIDKSIQEASEDSAQYYLLSYPMDKREDFGWRKLKVEVKVPDVRVRARSGYYYTEGTFDPAKSRQVDMVNALNSPVNYTAIPLSLRWGNQVDAQGKKKVGFEVRIPGGALNVDDAQANLITFDVAMIIRDGKETEAGRFWQEVKIRPKAESLTVIQRDGVNYRNLTEVTPGTYQVRVVVRDNLSGKIGSLLAPLEVK